MRRSNLIFYILIGLLPFSLTACGKNETAVQQSLPPLIKVGTVEYANNTSPVIYWGDCRSGTK